MTDNVDGREVVVGRIDRGTYQEALQHNPIFREWVEKDNNLHSPSMQGKGYVPSRKTYSHLLTEHPLLTERPLLIEMADGASSYLLTDSWGQEYPYNILCPMVDTLQCKTGCVATAMSQIMNYYRYPEQGMGSHTYIDSTGCEQTLTADFGSHTYEWNYMLDSYSGISFSQRQAQAVALLASDAGISVDMRYGVKESGAASINQPIALTTYFGYDRGIRQIFRDFYSRDQLYSLLIDEIQSGRPVLCSGYGIDGGGHAFVIDGYDGAGLFHINWGWYGYADGFYNIDYMCSHQPQWNLFRDRREGGANILQSFTIGIQPQPQAVDSREMHEYAFSHITLIDSTASEASIGVYNLSNIGWNTHRGTVALALCPIDQATPIAIVHTYDRTFALEEISDTTYTDTISIDTQWPSLPAQTCRLLPVFQEDDGTWREALTCRGTPNYLLAHIDEHHHLSLGPSATATAKLRLDSYLMPDTMVRWQSPHMALTITNDSPAEYCGRIYIAYTLGPDIPLYGVITGVGLYLEPGQTETLDFLYSPIRNRADTMHVCAFYDVDLFTDSIVMLPLEKDVIIVDKTTGIDGIHADKATATSANNHSAAFDLAGRRIRPTSALPNQIIITEDGKKRSIQNVP